MVLCDAPFNQLEFGTLMLPDIPLFAGDSLLEADLFGLPFLAHMVTEERDPTPTPPASQPPSPPPAPLLVPIVPVAKDPLVFTKLPPPMLQPLPTILKKPVDFHDSKSGFVSDNAAKLRAFRRDQISDEYGCKVLFPAVLKRYVNKRRAAPYTKRAHAIWFRLLRRLMIEEDQARPVFTIPRVLEMIKEEAPTLKFRRFKHLYCGGNSEPRWKKYDQLYLFEILPDGVRIRPSTWAAVHTLEDGIEAVMRL